MVCFTIHTQYLYVLLLNILIYFIIIIFFHHLWPVRRPVLVRKKHHLPCVVAVLKTGHLEPHLVGELSARLPEKEKDIVHVHFNLTVQRLG